MHGRHQLTYVDPYPPPSSSDRFNVLKIQNVLVLACLGVSPASRATLMAAAIFLFVFLGLIAGYHSARLYNTMNGKEWKKSSFLASSVLKFVTLSYLILCFRSTDCYVLPRSHFFDLRYPQYFHLGQTQQRSHTIGYHAACAVSLVLHLFPSRISGLLFRLPQNSIRAPRPHQSDPSTDTRASVVHEPGSLVS